jgi:hypothetical protein
VAEGEDLCNLVQPFGWLHQIGMQRVHAPLVVAQGWYFPKRLKEAKSNRADLPAAISARLTITEIRSAA